MKKVFLVLLVLTSLNITSQTKADSLLLTNNEWVNKDLDYLRFINDTVVYNLNNDKQELLFNINKRKLYFKVTYRSAGEIRNETFEFNIKELQNNRLIIEPSAKDEAKLTQYRKLNVNPLLKEKQYIFYNRGQLISRVNFKKITFHSSTCFGTCPSMSVEVNNDGTVYYNGRSYTGDYSGSFEGKLDAKNLLELRKIINRSQLYVLDQKWKQLTKHNDTPRYNYIVELANGKVIEINTNDQHPILDKLSYYLLSITKKATLVKSEEKHTFATSTIENYRVSRN